MNNGSQLGPLDLLYGVAEDILRLTQGTFSLHTLSDFIDSVQWSEPFIISLIMMQICTVSMLYLTRRHHNVQFVILILLTCVTLAAESLNRLGKTHWSSFASQDYFDSNGLFMLVFVTAPFLIYANIIVVCSMQPTLDKSMKQTFFYFANTNTFHYVLFVRSEWPYVWSNCTP